MADSKTAHTSVGSEYMHPRTYRDSARLHLQHWIWKEHLGYILHPSVPREGSHCRVADIGTGNGCWLLDLSQEVPETWSLEGFDVSPKQFPSKHNLRSNVSLSVQDAFEPVPAELQGKFDIVHVRAFAAVVKHGDPGPLTQNLVQLLKPGGFLQWDEFDAGAFVAHASSPEMSTEKSTETIRVFNSLATSLSLDWSWMAPGVMAQSFRKHGLTVVNDTNAEHWTSPEQFKPLLRKAYTDNWMMALDETSAVIISRKNNAEPQVTLEEFRTLMDGAVQEVQDGVSMWIDLQVVVGQKN